MYTYIILSDSEGLNNLPIVAPLWQEWELKWNSLTLKTVFWSPLPWFPLAMCLHSLVTPSKEGAVAWGRLGSQKAYVNFGIHFCPGLLVQRSLTLTMKQLATLRRQINRTALYFLNFYFLWTHVHTQSYHNTQLTSRHIVIVRSYITLRYFLFMYFCLFLRNWRPTEHHPTLQAMDN